MQFRDFEQRFKDHQLIKSQDIKIAFGNFNRVQLSRWEKQGLLTRVRPGHYLLSSQINELDTELLANEVRNSYISLEYALNYYNLIPEVPRAITSVTTERGEILETPLGNFIYRKIKPALFTGYQFKDSQLKNRKVKIAFPTKALFDFIYLKKTNCQETFEDLRLNFDELRSLFQPDHFYQWLSLISNAAIKKHLEHFLEFLKNHA